ncbi:SDR family oxidoreductase [Ruania suaedae]|uniref:SDR family NAD(P)-dependent oxidoreductase n=1 Tax=Ruania suaedae TaxID=2897774 RepID=UPI001E445C01|nr:SDR family oxidoreductase [Ruania suaedae]UFU02942.1 SDR family oxidoreductase [Ruania suaedae]
MDLELVGRRAFISGSTQGIGAAIAEVLLIEGASVVINGRSQERVDARVESLRSAHPGSDVMGIAADLEDAGQTQTLLDRLGPVDILVNNAGVFEMTEFSAISDEEWQRYLQTNLMSGVRLSRHLLPGMLERDWGRILFIASESGVDVPPGMIHYGVTKAAVLALGNGLAKLTRGTQVTVNTILGGPTYSDGVAQAIEKIARAQGAAPGDLKAAIAAQNRTSLLERFLEPAEIASLAAYLVSPVASATNGAALRADGGTLTTTL